VFSSCDSVSSNDSGKLTLPTPGDSTVSVFDDDFTLRSGPNPDTTLSGFAPSELVEFGEVFDH
jgi:hypothetical protein